jgi:hypothetical protein
MAVTGFNLVKLTRLARGLAGIPSRAAKPIAAHLSERVLDCYRGEHDPYDVRWAPLAESTVRRKRGNTVILYRTGKSGADCGARALRGTGVAVYAGGAATHHQEPSGSRPARPVLPTRGLPPKWRADIAAILGDEYAKALGKATR